MELKVEQLEFPDGCNVVVGQSHFIKTVEDLYEIMVGEVPTVKFGLAFCEASGDCLLRIEGNDDELKKVAETNGLKISAGHTFFLVMKDAFPINVLNAKDVSGGLPHLLCHRKPGSGRHWRDRPGTGHSRGDRWGSSQGGRKGERRNLEKGVAEEVQL